MVEIPLYSFDCPECGLRVQKALVKDRRWMDCPRCGAMMKRQDYTKEPFYLDDKKSTDAYNMEKIEEREYKEAEQRRKMGL